MTLSPHNIQGINFFVKWDLELDEVSVLMTALYIPNSETTFARDIRLQ